MAAMASGSMKRRRVAVVAVLAAGAVLGLMAGVVGTLRSLTWADFPPAPWEDLRVPLPEGSGSLTFRRRSIHPLLAEYEREITLVPASGARFDTTLRTNHGGRTLVFLFWRSGGAGPALLLHERRHDTLVDPERGRVIERGKSEPPVTSPEWRYFGRIDGTGGRFRFVAETHWTGGTDRDR